MDTIVTKKCKRCEKEKPISEFHNEDLRVLGEGKYCRNCLQIKLKLLPNKKSHTNSNYNHVTYNNSMLSKAQVLRKVVLNYYGSACECCGETKYEFLAIDHKNNDGGRMRRNKEHPTGGYSFYKWIIDNNFPDIFRVLCHNCNMSLGSYGYCPHQEIHT